MNTKLSTSRTAPTRSLKKQKRDEEEIRFWKNVALSLVISMVNLILTLLIALLLR